LEVWQYDSHQVEILLQKLQVVLLLMTLLVEDLPLLEHPEKLSRLPLVLSTFLEAPTVISV
jgi:hypothetical protein